MTIVVKEREWAAGVVCGLVCICWLDTQLSHPRQQRACRPARLPAVVVTGDDNAVYLFPYYLVIFFLRAYDVWQSASKGTAGASEFVACC